MKEQGIPMDNLPFHIQFITILKTSEGLPASLSTHLSSPLKCVPSTFHRQVGKIPKMKLFFFFFA